MDRAHCIVAKCIPKIPCDVPQVGVETLKACPADTTIKLHFLVEDGEITADATVRYVETGSGLGLKFKNVRTEDQGRFATMIRRLIKSP